MQKNISALNAAVNAAESIIESAKKETEKKRAALDGIISAARDASATVGVAHFLVIFLARRLL